MVSFVTVWPCDGLTTCSGCQVPRHKSDDPNCSKQYEVCIEHGWNLTVKPFQNVSFNSDIRRTKGAQIHWNKHNYSSENNLSLFCFSLIRSMLMFTELSLLQVDWLEILNNIPLVLTCQTELRTAGGVMTTAIGWHKRWLTGRLL